MPRITSKQNTIFKNHIKAWKESKFSQTSDLPDAESIKAFLESGGTLPNLWFKLVEKHVSITSQIALNAGYLSGVAEKQMRKAFKDWLNWLDATVQQNSEFSEVFKVFKVSENTNSFGLRQMIMVSKAGTTYKACFNYLNVKKEGELIKATIVRNSDKTIKYHEFSGAELVERCKTCPQHILKTIWSN